MQSNAINLSGSRLSLTPTRARFIHPVIKEGDEKPKLVKGGISDFLEDRTYYYADYDRDNPAHAGLSAFLIYTNDPDAPAVNVRDLREALNEDIANLTNYGDLLRILYPLYIVTRNYMDAVDEALTALNTYHGPVALARFINVMDSNFYLDLKWLNEITSMRNTSDVSVDVFGYGDDDNIVLKGSYVGNDIVTWNTADGYAIIHFNIVTGEKLSYFLAPIYFNDVVEFKLIRARLVRGQYELYVDNYGYVHVQPMKEMLSDLMHFDISFASVHYFLKHGRAAVATIGAIDDVTSNGVEVGRNFALKYINRNYHPDHHHYLESMATNYNAAPIEGSATEIDTNATAIETVHPAENP